MRRGNEVLCALLVAAAAGVPAYGEEVLGSYTGSGMIGAGLTADSIRIFMGYGTNPFALEDAIGEARQVSGSTLPQVIEYRSDTPDADYSGFVARLLDDTGDNLFVITTFWGSVVGGGNSGTDGPLLGLPADLTGYQISGLRLTVQPFEVINDSGFSFAQAPGGGNFTYTWQVLGEVPEPATAALLAFASPLALSRPRRS